jgi:UDP-hydrolysing UDP-N-acetyl-D-glucosamine 2-epimerase
MNIPIAHIQGGDVSGTIDESIRHAITKLAHVHFPTSEKSKERLLRMGENPTFVFMTGCPTIDYLTQTDLSLDSKIFERNGNGFGKAIDLSKPYVLVLQHPVTTEHGKVSAHIKETLAALEELNMPVLMLAPNIDAGSDAASKAVRDFAAHNTLPGFSLYKNFFPDDFYRVLNGATIAVGNSSSFIREGSYLGVPAVLVGTRQKGRERASNIVEVPYHRKNILEAMKKQIVHRRYAKSTLYGDGTASQKIADILASITAPVQKVFYEKE